VPDDTANATSGAPTADASLANKKYVDNQDIDLVSDGVSKSKDTNYTAATSGTLVVYGSTTWVYLQDQYIVIKSDAETTPTTIVGKVGGYCARADSAQNIVYHHMSVPIVKGKKYRIEDTNATITSMIFYPNQ